MSIVPLPAQYRLSIDLTREEARELIAALPPEQGTKRSLVEHRLLDDLEQIATFDPRD